MKKESYESRTDPKKKRKSTAPKGTFAKENCHFLFMLVCERQVFSCWFLLQNIFFNNRLKLRKYETHDPPLISHGAELGDTA